MSRLSIHSLFRCAAIAAILIGLDTGIVAQEPRGGPAEERLVRQTYLRLSLLNRAALRRDLSRKGVTTPQEDGAIGFVLGDFRTGPIEEILSRPIAEVATFPAGDIVRLVERSVKETADGDEMVGYDARWSAAQYSNTYDPNVATVSEMLRLMGADYTDVGKYTSYSVTVTLEGRSRSYRALLLFHTPYGSSVDAKADFWDAIVGMGGVLTDISRDLRPPLGSGPRRPQNESNPSQLRDKDQSEDGSDPGLAGPVLSQSYCDGLYPICCPAGAWGMDQCCWDGGYPWGNPGWLPTCRGRVDGGGGGGGGGGDEGGGGGSPGGGETDPSEPRCNYTFRAGQGVNLSHADATGHSEGFQTICSWYGGVPYCYVVPMVAGEHRANTMMHGECLTQTNCNKRCNVVVDSHEVYDFGNTGLLYHVAKEKSAENNDATGDASATLTCAGGYGYAVDQCLTPFCPITIVVSVSASPFGVGAGLGVSVLSSAMWHVPHGLSHQCEPTR